MNIELLELAESALGELVDQVVFVGGATVGRWITDLAAPPVRPTDDVDVVVEVATRSGFYEFESELRKAGLREDQRCRLRSEATIKAAPPVYMLAMKLKAFKGRGNGDFLARRDFDDIVTLVDGRSALLEEVAAADADVRAYSAEEMRRLLIEPRLMDGLDRSDAWRRR